MQIVNDGKGEFLRGAVSLAHFFLKSKVSPGDKLLDGTCGLGQDSLFLAKLTGVTGKLWSFDTQPTALMATRELLRKEGYLDIVRLIEASHDKISEFVPLGLSAAVFNLGYLPGGDLSIVTSPESTISALEQSSRLLKRGGIIVVSVYTGHQGGIEEAFAVEKWCSQLDAKYFNVWSSHQLNRSSTAPYLILIERNR